MELASSTQFVSAILGDATTQVGKDNRQIAASLQKLDFVFIPIYAAFFIATGAVIAGSPACWPVVLGAVLTAAFDYLEDYRILGILGSDPNPPPPKPIGQAKWVFYFLTLAAEGILVLESKDLKAAKGLIGVAVAVFLILNGIGGVVSSIKGSFAGSLTATKLSFLGLLLLALTSLVLGAPFSWRTVALYAVLLRVPLLTAITLVLLPYIAFRTGARSLLRGLFDLTPWSVFVVALAVLAAAGSATEAAYIVLVDGSLRFGAPIIEWSPGFGPWISIMIGSSLPVIVVSVGFSTRQRHGFWPCVLGALGGGGLAVALTEAVRLCSHSAPFGTRFPQSLVDTGLFKGYAKAGGDHVFAALGFLATLLVYIAVGIYGYSRLGHKRTVPALCSALMVLTMLTWMLSGVAFFFDQWRIPVLLIVGIAGTLTAQSVRSDDFYQLRPRSPDPMPNASDTIKAAKSPRVIVAAANGGGIQAAAWAAQVLSGLEQDCGEAFRRSLRMISSVSGGSVGSAFYVHSLAHALEARPPAEAAAESSLDEVAWGLAWTDFLRALLPWLFGSFIGRGRALEKAWRLNAAANPAQVPRLDRPLSSWNRQVATGEIPAIVMNATIVETGERLLLATTCFGGQSPAGKARVDATDLHRINGKDLDVGIAAAARLSASFPYVTPASRSDGPGPQPHVVDGGYYDNYGMGTMVEWLDEALTGAQGTVTDVLVLQIHGAPINENSQDQRHEKTRGWFYQAIAPLTTLAAVRNAGQIAHNEIELELLRQKWAPAGVTIDTVVFEFSDPAAPLSWHLTPDQVRAIAAEWSDKMEPCRHRVRKFLAGQSPVS